MTIALSIKVNDGIVLSTDSAATIFAQRPNSEELVVMHVYNNAEKLFNLCKGYPIGIITWGSGSIGQASISTIVKDFRKSIRQRLKDEDSYTIKGISQDFARYVFEEKYLPEFKDWLNKPAIGFMVCGYSHNEDFAEEWKFDIIDGELRGPKLIRGQDQSGMTWNGEPEAITRLYFGFSNHLPQILADCGIGQDKIDEVMNKSRDSLQVPFIIPPLPIKDAIDIGEFLVQTTINFSRYSPGVVQSVGGPIDIAAITKHEGFKWVKRKYYFQRELNPNDYEASDVYTEV